jgi:hypothetical protein
MTARDENQVIGLIDPYRPRRMRRFVRYLPMRDQRAGPLSARGARPSNEVQKPGVSLV